MEVIRVNFYLERPVNYLKEPTSVIRSINETKLTFVFTPSGRYISIRVLITGRIYAGMDVRFAWNDGSTTTLPVFGTIETATRPVSAECVRLKQLPVTFIGYSTSTKCRIEEALFSGIPSHKLSTGTNDFYYSNEYEDDEFEYRHVHVTKEVAKLIPKNRLMSETEWRSLGIQQSPGWIHYMIHGPERHVLLFRRPLAGAAKGGAVRGGAENAVGVR